MAGITLTQVAEYIAMITNGRFQKFTEFNQRGFYKRFCAAQDFEELIGIDTTTNMSIEAIDYNEWKTNIHGVQRSSTPLLRAQVPEILDAPFEKEGAALFMLMGHRIIDSEESYESLDDTVAGTVETLDYCGWKTGFAQIQRSSTPLVGPQESDMLFQSYEMENAAMFMLMGHRIIKEEY